MRHAYQAGTFWMQATYNGDGLRATKQDFWTPWHHYTWGLGGVLVDSSDGGNGVNNTIVYTPGVSQNVNGTDSFFDVDWLGSTRYLTDGTGNNATAQERYDAFGEVSYTNPSNWDPSNFQWASDWGYQAEWSASYEPGIGLEYLRNRYYDPATGRFISADPLGYLGGLNLFSYADNDPVMNLDPSGLLWKERLSLLGGILGGVAGGVAGEGVGALPGSAWGSGFGAFIGSRLDGDSVGRAVVNGVVEGAVSYGTGKLAEVGVNALRAARAARAARALQEAGQLRALPPAAGAEPVFDWRPARVGHIFRPAFGHIDPATLASQARFARLFQLVAANPANLRADAVAAGLIAPQAAAAGVRVFTQTFRSGQQVWVTVRNGVIENAGINRPGARR